MRVRFLVRWQGYRPGDTANLPTDIARKLIRRKWAEQDMSVESWEVHYRVSAKGEMTELANREAAAARLW